MLNWVTGIKVVHFQKNSYHHSGIKRTLYSALFGNEACVGLTSSLPREILETIETEQDLVSLDLHPPTSRPSATVTPTVSEDCVVTASSVVRNGADSFLQ